MAGCLTTHVLDTSRGRPAAGLLIELFRIDGDRRTKPNTKTTNEDGRTDAPILPEDAFETGSYELLFHAGAYLDMIGQAVETSRFLDFVPIRFGMSEQTHYHVPMLLSPFGFSTYRDFCSLTH
ncbi:MAG: hydroxyisourate hydrolase [Geminicoccales bacterium]